MSNPINGLKTSADFRTGIMTITVVQNGKEVGTTEIATKDAGRLAGLLLNNAKSVFDLSGRELPPWDPTDKVRYFSLEPTSLALSQSPIPDCESLVVRFGETAVGIAIPRSQLLELGQQLTALGGPQSGPAH